MHRGAPGNRLCDAVLLEPAALNARPVATLVLHGEYKFITMRLPAYFRVEEAAAA
jgi:hypothetical protein